MRVTTRSQHVDSLGIDHVESCAAETAAETRARARASSTIAPVDVDDALPSEPTTYCLKCAMRPPATVSVASHEPRAADKAGTSAGTDDAFEDGLGATATSNGIETMTTQFRTDEPSKRSTSALWRKTESLPGSEACLCKEKKPGGYGLFELVEMDGLEPTTSNLQSWRSTN